MQETEGELKKWVGRSQDGLGPSTKGLIEWQGVSHSLTHQGRQIWPFLTSELATEVA